MTRIVLVEPSIYTILLDSVAGWRWEVQAWGGRPGKLRITPAWIRRIRVLWLQCSGVDPYNQDT